MYIPRFTAAVILAGLIWLVRPEPSTAQKIFNVAGLNAYNIGFDLTALVILGGVACLIDECYRFGPNELQKKLRKLLSGGSDVLDGSLSASGSSTDTPKTDSSPSLTASAIGGRK